MPTLREILDQRVREAAPSLVEDLGNNRVRCFSCGHCCPIPEGQPGVCKVRFNRGGKLYVPWGYTAGMQCDPIEKKPFFHAHPGALAYSFGMLGCDLHCGYCQNWVTSQALRDPDAVSPPLKVTPETMVREAVDLGAKVLVSTYNEPLITSEWAVAVFKEARAAGLLTAFVSNGNGTPQVLEFLRPWIDLYKIDLKSFDDRHYHELGGRIGPILDTIRRVHSMGMWLEIVTLLIPGFNDSNDELKKLSEFVAGVSPDIPWHVTAFHTDYKMQGPRQRDTTADDLLRAMEIGHAAGLRYVYAGNLPGRVGDGENTICPQCGEILIRRYGYLIEDYNLTPEGRCPRCSHQIPGRWAQEFDGQIASRPFLPHNRSRLFTIAKHL
ncbi:MAG TPA: AmmeMemoRadiSam system radical SAM enzyme [Candidatus Sulfotelmatobacter sp.]|nr:AmmeMemoRadiSam system radical SAM enzyme [Candidatus Sulfotelmatobacter sp.]